MSSDNKAKEGSLQPATDSDTAAVHVQASKKRKLDEGNGAKSKGPQKRKSVPKTEEDDASYASDSPSDVTSAAANNNSDKNSLKKSKKLSEVVDKTRIMTLSSKSSGSGPVVYCK